MSKKETLNKTDALDITEFDAVAESEHGHEFELTGSDGVTGTGIYLTVLGRHSDAVTKWTTATVNQFTREQQMAHRRGKAVEPKPIEEVREQNREGAAIRVTGWRNVKQPYSIELMKSALKRNPHWIDQIIEESDDLANFTKKQ